MELVPVRVADQDVAVVGHVNAVREEGDVLGRDATYHLTVEVDNNNSMALKWKRTPCNLYPSKNHEPKQ